MICCFVPLYTEHTGTVALPLDTFCLSETVLMCCLYKYTSDWNSLSYLWFLRWERRCNKRRYIGLLLRCCRFSIKFFSRHLIFYIFLFPVITEETVCRRETCCQCYTVKGPNFDFGPQFRHFLKTHNSFRFKIREVVPIDKNIPFLVCRHKQNITRVTIRFAWISALSISAFK